MMLSVTFRSVSPSPAALFCKRNRQLQTAEVFGTLCHVQWKQQSKDDNMELCRYRSSSVGASALPSSSRVEAVGNAQLCSEGRYQRGPLFTVNCITGARISSFDVATCRTELNWRDKERAWRAELNSVLFRLHMKLVTLLAKTMK